MRRSFISGSFCCFQLIEAHGCCKPSPDPQLVSYLSLLLLSCYWRCCSCLGSQPAPVDAVPAQTGPGRLDLSLPGCVAAGTLGLAAAPCWKLGCCHLPCYCTLCWPGNVSRGAASSGFAQPPALLCAPQREREIQGTREMTRSRVTNHTKEGAVLTGASRGCVLAADGLCSGYSPALVWICMTMRSIVQVEPGGTNLSEIKGR